MKRVHFYIDNLRIGGFQRLCLDQAYAFSGAGFSVEIHVLCSQGSSNPSFLFAESRLIEHHNIRINYLSGSFSLQLMSVRETLKSITCQDIVICHSLRATALLWLGQRLAFKKIVFLTTIHQLPTLSAPKQRLQRFIYSQLSPVLTAYSQAVINDWTMRVNNFPLLIRKLFQKDILLQRNGIYLPRVSNSVGQKVSSVTSRLIYLGRISSWKGVETFFEFARSSQLTDFRLLVIVPEISESLLTNLRNEFGERIEFQIGGSFSSYVPMQGDVHFYAAQYGEKAKYIESISLNCLEMASVGTPSVVTRGGLNTWPDLSKMKLFWECNWNNEEHVVASILEASRIHLSQQEISHIRNLIDVNRNLTGILDLLGKKS